MNAKYPRLKRITKRSEFRSVLQQGKRVRASDLDVRCLASPLEYVRVGLIVPLHGRSAVRRNQLKRRLRELVRVHLLSVPASVDIVLRCRASAFERDFEELQTQVTSIAKSVGEQFGVGGR